MKKIISMFVVFSMVLSLAACGGSGESAEEAVKNAFAAAQAMDRATVQKYFGDEFLEETMGDAVDDATDPEDVVQEELTGKFLKNLSCTVVESVEDGDAATVTAEITNLDLGLIMQEFMGAMIAEVLSGTAETEGLTTDETEAKYMAELNTLLEQDTNATVTNTVELTLNKVEGQWKIGLTDELMNSIFGGMMTFAESMNSFGQ